MEAYLGEAEHVYVVTLSGKLSGSYNSAELAKKLYLEEHMAKQIHVFDSCSASIGETLIAEKIQESEEAGKSFEEVEKELFHEMLEVASGRHHTKNEEYGYREISIFRDGVTL